MQLRPPQREEKSKLRSTQFFTRYAFKQYINNDKIYFGAINAV